MGDGLSVPFIVSCFLNILRKDDLEAQVELTLKVIERVRVIYSYPVFSYYFYAYNSLCT